MKKKVGLLTMPILDNYGGIIQIAALYHVVELNGYTPILINKRYNQSSIKVVVKKILENNPFYKIFDYNNHTKRKKKLVNITNFINDFFENRTAPLYNEQSLKDNTSMLDTVIVGSDQVWRYKYVKKNYQNYFLDFVGNGQRKISYAASFGVDKWEGDDETIENVTSLLRNFNAVGVREDIGRKICSETFDYNNSTHVLDPTLLPEVQFYNKIIDKEDFSNKISLFNYVLDKSKSKTQIIDLIANNKALSIDTISLNDSYENDKLKPSIAEWLYHIKEAEFVVTDSFHGTVFSIIFNKQFIAIGNRERGISRFKSLLKIFGLESRLVYEDDLASVDSVLSNEIDYDQVNSILKNEREKSLNFLLSNI